MISSCLETQSWGCYPGYRAMPKSAGPQLVPVHGKDMCSAGAAQTLLEAQHPEQKAASECSHTGEKAVLYLQMLIVISSNHKPVGAWLRSLIGVSLSTEQPSRNERRLPSMHRKLHTDLGKTSERTCRP